MAGVSCPQCGQTMAAAPDLAGRPVACPRCHFQFVMPGVMTAALAGAAPAALGSGAPPPVSSAFQASVSQRFKPAKSIFDIFDFRFETYVTPIIIRITWGLVLLGVVIYFGMEAYEAIGRLMPKTEPAAAAADVEEKIVMRLPEGAGGNADRTVKMLVLLALRVTLVLILVLWVRVLLETSIVLFNIATSLQSIDRKTKG